MDVQKTMAFILETQAKVETGLEQTREHVQKLAENQTLAWQAIQGLTAIQTHTDQQINTLVGVVEKLVNRNGERHDDQPER